MRRWNGTMSTTGWRVGTSVTSQPISPSALHGVGGAFRGAALALEHEAAHAFVDRGEVSVQELLRRCASAATWHPRAASAQPLARSPSRGPRRRRASARASETGTAPPASSPATASRARRRPRRRARRAPRPRRCSSPCGSSSPRPPASRRSRGRRPAAIGPSGLARDRPLSPANARTASSVSVVSPSWLTSTSTSALGRTPSTKSSACDAVAGRLRGVKGRAAARERATARPPGAGALDRSARSHAGCAAIAARCQSRRPQRLYTMRPRGDLRATLAVERHPRPDSADAAGAVDLVRAHVRRRLALRDEPRRTGSRTSPSTCSSRAPSAADRAPHRRRDRRRSAASSTPSRARSTPATTSAAPRSTATSPSTSSSTCSATRASTPTRSSARRASSSRRCGMHFDTPRDHIGAVYESLLYGDQPLGWEILGREETVRAATRDTFLAYIDQWYRPSAWSSASAAGSATARGRLDGLLGDMEPRETGSPAPVALPENGSPRRAAHEGLRSGAPRSRRAQLPARHPDRYALQMPVDRPRRRHVLAPLHRGARATGARLLRVRVNHAYTDAGTLAAQPGSTSAASTTPSRRSWASSGRSRTTRSCRGAREGAQLREGAVRAPAREPARDDHVRAAPRGARGRRGGAEVLAGSTPSPSTTSSASRRVIGWRLYLALVGPFDDPAASSSCSRLSSGLARAPNVYPLVRLDR